MMYASIQGDEVPVVGMGTYGLYDAACTAAVEDALAIGYRHVDTAEGYENEEAVGEALRNSGIPRDEIFLTTKIWIGDADADEVYRKGEDRLRKLNTDYVDLLLIHWPTPDMDLTGALASMVALKDEGKIRHIGVSNFTPELIDEALRHAPVFANQVEYHPYLSQDELLALCRERDIMLTAYSPVAKGRAIKDETLADIGRQYGKTAAQVAIRWLIQQEKVTTVPKAASPEHRRSNLDVFDFSLSDDDLERIAGLARDERLVDPEWAPW